MRDKTRIDSICNKLAEIWKSKCPDWRLAQLFCNLQKAYESDLFYDEDDKLIVKLEAMLGEDC